MVMTSLHSGDGKIFTMTLASLGDGKQQDLVRFKDGKGMTWFDDGKT